MTESLGLLFELVPFKNAYHFVFDAQCLYKEHPIHFVLL